MWSKMKILVAPVLACRGSLSDDDCTGFQGQAGDERDERRDIRVLEQLLRLGVIVGLDLVVVDKGLLLALVPVDLEAVAVERVLVLAAANVCHEHVGGRRGNFVRLRASGLELVAVGCNEPSPSHMIGS